MSKVLTRLGTMFGPVEAGKGGKWLGALTKLGTAFDPPAAVAPHAAAVVPPPETLIPATPPGSQEEIGLKAMIRELAVARKKDLTAQGKLERIRDMEYARPDGGRIGVKRMLSGAAGLGRPKAQEA